MLRLVAQIFVMAACAVALSIPEQHQFKIQGNELKCFFPYNSTHVEPADLAGKWFIWAFPLEIVGTSGYNNNSFVSIEPAANGKLRIKATLNRCSIDYPLTAYWDLRPVADLPGGYTSGPVNEMPLLRFFRYEIADEGITFLFVTNCQESTSWLNSFIYSSAPFDKTRAKSIMKQFQQIHLDHYPLDFYWPFEFATNNCNH
jgi:hypothetical protein